MKILQVVSSLENPAAGTTYCVRRLSETLARAGASVEVLTLGSCSALQIEAVTIHQFKAVGRTIPAMGTLLFSPELKRYLLASAASTSCVIHSNGLWRMPNVYPGQVARKCKVPLVVSPHGMLGVGALQFSSAK